MLLQAASTIWGLLAGFGGLDRVEEAHPNTKNMDRYKIDEARVVAMRSIARMMAFYVQAPAMNIKDREVWNAVEVAVHMLRDWYGVDVSITPLTHDASGD